MLGPSRALGTALGGGGGESKFPASCCKAGAGCSCSPLLAHWHLFYSFPLTQWRLMPQAALLRGERICLLPRLNCLGLTLGGCDPCDQQHSLGDDALLLRRAELPWLHWPPGDAYRGGGELGHGAARSSHEGIYSSSSCSLFLLGCAAPGYCRQFCTGRRVLF